MSASPDSVHPPDDSARDVLAAPALLRLLQLTSPALPIGGFAFSQGLESAYELGFLPDEASAQSWLHGTLADGMARLDLPILKRLRAAFVRADRDAAAYWTSYLLASRESEERRLEDQQVGRALSRLLVDQGVPGADGWLRDENVTHACLFALAAAHFRCRKGRACSDLRFLGPKIRWARSHA